MNKTNKTKKTKRFETGITMHLTEDQRTYYRALGGSRFLRGKIDASVKSMAYFINKPPIGSLVCTLRCTKEQKEKYAYNLGGIDWARYTIEKSFKESGIK